MDLLCVFPHQIFKGTLKKKSPYITHLQRLLPHWVPPGTEGDHQWVEVQIGVAWLQLRNVRNSPCKHLMLGRSPHSYLPVPIDPFDHHDGKLFITITPSSSSTRSSCGLCSAIAGGVASTEGFCYQRHHVVYYSFQYPPMGKQSLL